MSLLRASIVVPALSEGNQIGLFLSRLEESVELPVEVLIVVDTPTDSTLEGISTYSAKNISYGE